MDEASHSFVGGLTGSPPPAVWGTITAVFIVMIHDSCSKAELREALRTISCVTIVVRRLYGAVLESKMQNVMKIRTYR